MTEIDFTDSQLPPDELAEYRKNHRTERQELRALLAAQRAHTRLCFGAEDILPSGDGRKIGALPLLILGE